MGPSVPLKVSRSATLCFRDLGRVRRRERTYVRTIVDHSLEFKEIRKEWKQRKKDEENARKAEEERQRTANGGGEAQPPSDPNQPPSSNFQAPGRPQLPPIGYTPGGQPVPQQYPGGVDQMYQPAPANGQVYAGYPHSPYGQGQ